MINKNLILISKIILIAVFLNLFAWTIFHVHAHGKKFGILTKPIKEFSQFPKLVMDAYRQIWNPERLLKIDPNFKPSNNLEYNLYALNAHFDNQKWNFQLTNLRNDSTIFEWFLEKKDYFNSGPIFSASRPKSPIILKDTSLVCFNNDSYNLFRINSKSEIMWKIQDPKYLFHHTLNLDHSGNIWVCTKNIIQFPKINLEYMDDNITKIDVNNGKVLIHKSLSEILVENNLSHLIYGPAFYHKDPLHLNDIEPVLEDGTYWKKGDLFLSLRNTSTILLYRPSTNKVIRTIQGPFFLQHDIDIISDSTISLFNNNCSTFPKIIETKTPNIKDNMLNNSSYSTNASVLIYNLNDSSYTSLYPIHFEENKIFTRTQGRQHLLPNGDLFIESTDEGKVFLFNKKTLLIKKYFYQPVDGFVERPNWVRIYEDLNFLN
jgi:hypothetical protein